MRKLSGKLAGQQSGFTLIELVIVIVIIGILAAVAIPNFTNLSDDAKAAKADAVAGAYASWASANFARCSGKLSGAVPSVSCSTASTHATATTSAGIDTGGEAVGSTGGDSACAITVGGVAATRTVIVKATGGTC